ncbi:hypothetical protein QUF95_15565 [Paenibacillus silvae]|uniref:hypothetical protein n=1 Tax=Paenibacillus silvae TaxID=1325358 RepID=UPI0025A047B8|nr:hypothetical protein [Paenibacillus silvae]MDM5278816.1 hypothetical protein [Paenibacillus silvae]
MTETTLEGVQAKIDGLAKEHFSTSDYELFCALLLQLDKYKQLSDENREALYRQDKEFSEHMDIQQEKVESLNREVAYWQHKCTVLHVENERLKNKGEGAAHGGGDYPNGVIPKSG